MALKAARELLVLSGLWFIAAPAPAGAEVERATIAMPAITISFLAEYVAEDMHFWERRELEVKTVFLAGMGSMNGVISGSADFSFSSGASITRAAAHGQKLVTIASLNNTPGEYVVLRKDLAEAGHFDPAAPLAERALLLKGRRFAIGGVASISDAYLKVVAKAAGLGPADLIITPMQPPDMLGALARDAVDGFALGPPWPQTVVARGQGVIVADGVHGEPPQYNPFSSGILVTRPQFCVEHRSICVKLGKGLVDAVNFVYEHRDESVALLQKRFATLDPAVLAASFDAVKAMLPRPPVTTAAGLANADKMNEDAGLTRGDEALGSYDSLFDNEFVQ